MLVGASGSGKSSVLKCVYRTYLPTSGRIDYRRSNGQEVDLATADEQTVLSLRRQEIRFVSQFLHVVPRRSAHEVVCWPLLELGDSLPAAQSAAEQLLSQVGLPERLWSVPPSTFSGGERQLVNLARALVVRPRLLLLDEPTASLDPRSTQRVAEAIESLKGQGIAILAVFHDQRLVTRLADEVVELTGGLQPVDRQATP